MKKILAILLILTCLLGLVGCDPGRNTIDGNALLESTTKIELFYYENTNPRLINLYGKKTPTFDFGKATLIATLDDALFEDVVNDIAKQECLVFPRVLSEPIGKTMILYQENGNMVVLFSSVYKKENALPKYYGACYVFDENGVFVEHIGSISSDYVDTLESQYFIDNP